MWLCLDVTISLGDVIVSHNDSLMSGWSGLLQYQIPLDQVDVETTHVLLTHLKTKVQFQKCFPSESTSLLLSLELHDNNSDLTNWFLCHLRLPLNLEHLRSRPSQ